MSENLDLTVYKDQQIASTEIAHQSNMMREMAMQLWQGLRPKPYKQFINDLLDNIAHMGTLLEGFTDEDKNPWKDNVYYSYPQGGKTVHGGSTYLAEMLIRELHLVISLTVEFINIKGEDIIKITGQGLNPVHKILVPPTEMFYSGTIPEWCLREYKTDDKKNKVPISPEQLAANKARGLQIIVNNAKSKATREVAFKATGRDIGKLIAQIAYAREVKGISAKLADSRKACVEAFASIGIAQKQLHAYLGTPPELWNAVNIAMLRGLYARIKDAKESGDTTELAMAFDGFLDAKQEAAVTAEIVNIIPPAQSPKPASVNVPRATIDLPEEKQVNESKESKPSTKKRTRTCYFCNGKFHVSEVTQVACPEAPEETVDCCNACQAPTPAATEIKPDQPIITTKCSVCGLNKPCAPFGDEMICADCTFGENIFCPDCERFLHVIAKAGHKLLPIKDDRGIVTGSICSVCKGE